VEQGRLQFLSIAKLRLELFEAFFVKRGSASKTLKNFDTFMDKGVCGSLHRDHKGMDQINSQELARRFNDDEAVWRPYKYLRSLRIRSGIESLLPDDVLDELDWIEAQREGRDTWCRASR
jgi:hypothetical protein